MLGNLRHEDKIKYDQVGMTLHSSFHAPHYDTPISSHELPLLTKTNTKSKGSEKCHWSEICTHDQSTCT